MMASTMSSDALVGVLTGSLGPLLTTTVAAILRTEG